MLTGKVSAIVMAGLAVVAALAIGWALIQRNTITSLNGQLDEAMRVAKRNEESLRIARDDAVRTADALGVAARQQQQAATALQPARQVIYATPQAGYASCLSHPGIAELRRVAANGNRIPTPTDTGGDNRRSTGTPDATGGARLQRVSRVGS